MMQSTDWMIGATCHAEMRGHGAAGATTVFDMEFPVCTDGTIKKHSGMWLRPGWGASGSQFIELSEQDQKTIQRFWMRLLVPWLVAVSLTHCKNVTIHRQSTPTKVARKRRKNGKRSIDYHVLEIKPMQRVVEQAGSKGDSLQKRLHICRGHFKDYREGRGLFGQHHGLFWWNMHARGDVTAGEVHKGYKVAAQ
jgi:hypothetical protein